MTDHIKVYKDRTPGSAALFERAKKVMPGGVCHNPRYYPPYPIYINKAEGSKIWDVDGNEYIDLWMGHYVHILGHKPAVTTKAMAEAQAIGSHWGIVTEWQIDFAEDVCRIVPCAERVRFGISGTEATMYAVRLARAFTGRKTILKVRGGWHGSNSDLAVAVHNPMDVSESAGLTPDVTEFTKTISFNDTEGTVAVIRKYASDLADVVIEGLGQYFIPPVPGYLEAVQAETKKAGAVFVLDEVITGCRLSLRGAQGRFNLKPDLTTMGKVLGGGAAFGLVAGRKDILELANPLAGLPKGKGVLMGGGTFSAMLPAVFAGRALLRYLEAHENEIYPALDEKGRQVREGVEKAMRANGIEAKCFGVGSLYSTCFPASADKPLRNIEDVEGNTNIVRRDQEFKVRMLNHGVYTQWGGGAISYAHSDKDLDKIIQAAGEVAAEMAEADAKKGK